METGPNAHPPDRFVRRRPDRPLLICDADEVLLAFMAAYERHLHDQDLYFDWQAFRLTGSVRHRRDDTPLDQSGVSATLSSFFDAYGGRLDAVPGAAEALTALERHLEVVILSNVSAHRGPHRARNLTTLGMDYPLVVNTGPKGPAARRLAAQGSGPVFFIDDSPQHHASVAEAVPRSHRIHFVSDPRLARLIDQAPESHYRARNWPDIHDHIVGRLSQGR